MTNEKAPAWQGEGKNRTTNRIAEGSVVSKTTGATLGVNPDEVSREWLASNEALVNAIRPSWADGQRIHIDLSYGEVESVVFVREVGDVTIEQWFIVDTGALTALHPPRVCLAGEDSEEGVFTPARAARIAVGLMAAAVALGSDATVSDLHAAAVDAGLSTGDVYTAMVGNL